MNEAKLNKKMITTVCCGQKRVWKSRQKAKDFFLDCIFNSEGSERDRYTAIYQSLEEGKMYCSDEE